MQLLVQLKLLHTDMNFHAEPVSMGVKRLANLDWGIVACSIHVNEAKKEGIYRIFGFIVETVLEV